MKDWRQYGKSILCAEGLSDWKIHLTEAGPYCWIEQKRIDIPAHATLSLFLHEVAHALHPEPEGERKNHYHGGQWAQKFGELIDKYMEPKSRFHVPRLPNAPVPQAKAHLTSDGTCMDCNRIDCVCAPAEQGKWCGHPLYHFGEPTPAPPCAATIILGSQTYICNLPKGHDGTHYQIDSGGSKISWDDASALQILRKGEGYVGIPCPPEYSETCQICGTMVKPGEKCLSCGKPVEQGEPHVGRIRPECVVWTCLDDSPVEKVTEWFVSKEGHFVVLTASGESLRFDSDGYFPYGERGADVKSRLLFLHNQPSPAPSEPELPPLAKREYKDFESQVDDFLVQRQEQLLAAQREIQQLRQQLAQIKNGPITMPPMEWHNGANYCLAIEVAKKLTEAGQTIAALRQDNARIAELEHDVAEWSTVANLGNDRIAAAKAVGVVFADPGTTCVNQRAEDAEAKVRGLSARFICQAELEGGK